MQKLNKQMSSKNITIELTPKAKEYIANKGYSDLYGAREITRVIDEDIKEALIDAILFGELKDGGKVKVDCPEGKLTFVFNI